jgi:hypothetical protein
MIVKARAPGVALLLPAGVRESTGRGCMPTWTSPAGVGMRLPPCPGPQRSRFFRGGKMTAGYWSPGEPLGDGTRSGGR